MVKLLIYNSISINGFDKYPAETLPETEGIKEVPDNA